MKRESVNGGTLRVVSAWQLVRWWSRHEEIMATIHDVARAAGVSVATVSHVINASRQVLPETRAKVLAAINDLKYRRDGVARSLRRSKTGTIGVMISDISNPYFSDLVLGIEEAIHVADDRHTLILCNTEENAEKERVYLDLLQEKRVDGIIAVPVGGNHALFRAMIEADLPVVCVDRTLSGVSCDAVVLDNREAARKAVAHLLALGHRRIAMLRADQRTDAMDDRAAGYCDALKARALPLDPGLVFESESRIASARRVALELIDAGPLPDAVFTTNNFMTLGLMRALAERGLSCPENIAIAGFDDFPWATAFRPRLTVVSQPSYLMGQEAVGLLFDRMNKRRNGSVVKMVLSGELLIRESCGSTVTSRTR